MENYYSKHPPLDYTIEFKGERTGVGKTCLDYGGVDVWNLFWLSDPEIENARGHPYQYESDLLLACVKDVNVLLGDRRLGDALLKLNPMEFSHWVVKMPVEGLACVALQGDRWLNNVCLKAHRWRLGGKQRAQVGNVVFADFKGRYRGLAQEELGRA